MNGHPVFIAGSTQAGRFGVSLFVMVVACCVVALIEAVVGFPPFLIFALAVAASVWYSGFVAGLFAVRVAGLATDVFFVMPRFTLSLNSQVFVLGVVYLASAAIVQAKVLRATRRSSHPRDKNRR